MSWRRWRWWLAGVLVYLIFLLATLPAGYAAAWLQKHLPGVVLAGVSGSVWSGSAQELALRGQSWGRLRWQFDWGAPFAGRLGYRLQLQDSDLSLQGRVAAGRGNKLLLRDVSGQVDVGRLQPWLPLPPGSLNGRLHLQLARLLLLGDRPVAADGTLELDDASLTWPQAVTLGSYRLKLQSQDDSGIRGSLVDTGGPLILQGGLSLAANGRYQVSGSLASRDPANTTLNQLLRQLPVDAAGNHPFAFSGRW